jgi:hypothetical protein
MTWSNAKSIDRLVQQLDERFPTRSKAADGDIGDVNHQNKNSDHNPWVRRRDGTYAVTAQDITHDPAHGLDCHLLAQQLLNSRDKRIKYIIWNNRIIAGRDGPNPWVWRTYKGSNPHRHHLHLSVEDREELFDNAADWDFKLAPTSEEVNAPKKPTPKLLKNGMTGTEVAELQRLLNDKIDARLKEDGDFGPRTDRAVRIFQKEQGLVADGVVGLYTWEKLNTQEKI